MPCENCGAINQWGSPYCPECGAKTKEVADTRTLPPPPPPGAPSVGGPTGAPPPPPWVAPASGAGIGGPGPTFAAGPGPSGGPGAGASPGYGRASSFCSSCGKPIHPQAAICLSCGVQTGIGFGGKSKSVALILAIFLGPWTWVYTYARDKTKFWLSFVGAITLDVIAYVLFTHIFTTVRISACPSYPTIPCSPVLASANDFFHFMLFAGLFGFGVWLCAVILAATRSDAFYAKFPVG